MFDPFLGEIVLLPYDRVPEGWALCDGQILEVRQNPQLFYVIRSNFGGDGIHTFALPNLKGKEPAPNMRYFIALNGSYPQF